MAKSPGCASRVRKPSALRAFDGLVQNCDLLSQGEVLDSRRSVAKKQSPEKEKDGLKDAHDAVLLRLANGQLCRN